MRSYQELFNKANKRIIRKITKKIEKLIIEDMKKKPLDYSGTDINDFVKLDYKTQEEIKRQLETAGFSFYGSVLGEGKLHIYKNSN